MIVCTNPLLKQKNPVVAAFAEIKQWKHARAIDLSEGAVWVFDVICKGCIDFMLSAK